MTPRTPLASILASSSCQNGPSSAATERRRRVNPGSVKAPPLRSVHEIRSWGRRNPRRREPALYLFKEGVPGSRGSEEAAKKCIYSKKARGEPCAVGCGLCMLHIFPACATCLRTHCPRRDGCGVGFGRPAKQSFRAPAPTTSLATKVIPRVGRAAALVLRRNPVASDTYEVLLGTNAGMFV